MQKSAGTLTRIEFDVLSALLESFADFSAEVIAEEKAVDTQLVLDTVSSMQKQGWLDANGITALGLVQLEPYKVQRAVIMAAGFGSRLVPITLNTPKPLVRVHGKRMIDSVLDAVVAAGIEEIVIIRGYLGEQFDQLRYKYPQVQFVENPIYNQANNISSMVYAKALLKRAYVMEADLLLSNPKLIKKYQYCSNFLGIPVEQSDDWCFVVQDGVIRAQIPNGNEYKDKLTAQQTLYQEVGISYWSEEDGEKLERHLQEVFDRADGKSRYWDQVVFVDRAGQYAVEIRPCQIEDIVEIDSYRELVLIDEQYKVTL